MIVANIICFDYCVCDTFVATHIPNPLLDQMESRLGSVFLFVFPSGRQLLYCETTSQWPATSLGHWQLSHPLLPLAVQVQLWRHNQRKAHDMVVPTNTALWFALSVIWSINYSLLLLSLSMSYPQWLPLQIEITGVSSFIIHMQIHMQLHIQIQWNRDEKKCFVYNRER